MYWRSRLASTRGDVSVMVQANKEWQRGKLTSDVLGRLVVETALDGLDGVVALSGTGDESLGERGEILIVGVLLEVRGESDGVLLRRRGRVLDVVQRADLVGVDAAGASGLLAIGGGLDVGNTLGLGLLVDLKDGGGLGGELAEAGSGLDHVDVDIQLIGDRVLESAELGTRLVAILLVPGEGGVEQVVGLGDRGGEGNPVVVDLALDAVLVEPLGDGIRGLVRGGDQGADLLTAQMHAILRVVGGGHTEDGGLKSIGLVGGKGDLEGDALVGRGGADLLPARGDGREAALDMGRGARGEEEDGPKHDG